MHFKIESIYYHLRTDIRGMQDIRRAYKCEIPIID